MIVSELIIALQKLPQDATVMAAGRDYPEVIDAVHKLTKRDMAGYFYDGYYYPQFGTNPNVVVKI
jgi:hypothetical protein